MMRLARFFFARRHSTPALATAGKRPEFWRIRCSATRRRRRAPSRTASTTTDRRDDLRPVRVTRCADARRQTAPRLPKPTTVRAVLGVLMPSLDSDVRGGLELRRAAPPFKVRRRAHNASLTCRRRRRRAPTHTPSWAPSREEGEKSIERARRSFVLCSTYIAASPNDVAWRRRVSDVDISARARTHDQLWFSRRTRNARSRAYNGEYDKNDEHDAQSHCEPLARKLIGRLSARALGFTDDQRRDKHVKRRGVFVALRANSDRGRGRRRRRRHSRHSRL